MRNSGAFDKNINKDQSNLLVKKWTLTVSSDVEGKPYNFRHFFASRINFDLQLHQQLAFPQTRIDVHGYATND